MLHTNISSEPTVHDQRTDRSGAVLVKIAGTLKDKELAKKAVTTLFSSERDMSNAVKTASFPTDSPEQVFLSRVYFEGQRTKIAADKAAEIDKRLGVYEELHGVAPVDWANAFAAPAQPTLSVKTAMSAVALLPGCKIASADDLLQAQNDFLRDERLLTPKERTQFSANFVKAAACFDVADVPEKIRLYAGDRVSVNENLLEHVRLRKLAMERAGETSGYSSLYDELKDADVSSFSVPELQKLAEALEFADSAYDLHSRKTGKGIPSAWESVFRVKTAEEDVSSAAVEELNLPQTKADVISRYGEGILEEVEDSEGNLDMERLKEIVRNISGPLRTESKVEDAGDNESKSNA